MLLKDCMQKRIENVLRKIEASMILFLSANIHQGDELFSPQCRGKKCAFICLLTILTAQNNPPINWSTSKNG